jgi:hypothetical protein
MKASLTTASLFLVFATVAASASAQTNTGPSLASSCYGFSDYSYGGYGYHASTFEEGVLRGRAALAQGLGQGNYYHSLAAINYQDAYSRSIKNRQQAINGYFYNQQSNQAARDAKRSPRLSQERYVALARNAAPDRLGERQYDRTFGRLEWPAALSNDEFTAERDELDRAFAERSPSESGASSKFYATVQQQTSKLQAKLKSQIDVLDSAQYMAAKNYLLSLNYEATQPVVNRALAAR